MRFGWLVTTAAMAAQMACTIGAPAMNDSDGPSPIVEQLSVARRESLPSCTNEREALRAYVRAEKLVATCEAETWRDESGKPITTADAGTTDAGPSAELPGSSSGTVETE